MTVVVNDQSKKSYFFDKFFWINIDFDKYERGKFFPHIFIIFHLSSYIPNKQ